MPSTLLDWVFPLALFLLTALLVRAHFRTLP
jgi:hypothetical protein